MIKPIVTTVLFVALSLVFGNVEAVTTSIPGVTYEKVGGSLVITNNSKEPVTLALATQSMDGFPYRSHGCLVEIPETTPEHVRRKILAQHVAEHRHFLDSLKSKQTSDWSSLHRLALAGGCLAATRMAAFALPALIAPAVPEAPLHPDLGG